MAVPLSRPLFSFSVSYIKYNLLKDLSSKIVFLKNFISLPNFFSANDFTSLLKNNTNQPYYGGNMNQPSYGGNMNQQYYGTQNQTVDQYSYYGQLPSKGNSNFLPVTTDFSAFGW